MNRGWSNGELLGVLPRVFCPLICTRTEEPGVPLVGSMESPGTLPSSASSTLVTGCFSISSDLTVEPDPTLKRRELLPWPTTATPSSAPCHLPWLTSHLL